jgi:hypothetical protein
MCGHYLVFWEMKQVLLVDQADKTLQTRKNHAVQHFPDHALRFGSLIKSDAATYESAHISKTTGVWRRTSKRVSTQSKEMTDTSVTQTLATHLNYVSLIAKYGKDAIKYMGPVKDPEESSWDKLRTIKHYLTGIGEQGKYVVSYDRQLIPFDTYMQHKSLKEKVFRKFMEHFRMPDDAHITLVRGNSFIKDYKFY